MPIITRDVYCNFLTGTYEVSGVGYTLDDLISNPAAAPPRSITIDADGAVTLNSGDPLTTSNPLSTGPYNTTAGALYQTGFLVIMSFKAHLDGADSSVINSSDSMSSASGWQVLYDDDALTATIIDGSAGGGNAIALPALGLDSQNQFAAIIDPVAGQMAFSVNGSAVSFSAYVQTPITAANYEDSFAGGFGTSPTIIGWTQYIAYYPASIAQAPQLLFWSIAGDAPPAAIVSVDITGVSSFAAPGYTNHVRMTRSYTDGF
jgi:hypothetical protein